MKAQTLVRQTILAAALSRVRRLAVTLVLSIGLVVVASSSWADALDDAKGAGLVGETPQGLIASVQPSPSPQIANLVADINARRLTRYREIAAETGGTLEQVQALVGQRLIEATPSGSFVMGSDGAWARIP
jgi:uncharacterized protein YdbL (DUF1318 family)